jgi:hypothetical protein
MLVAGVTFANFTSDTSVIWVGYGATVTMVGCTFTDNWISGESIYRAIINVNAVDPTKASAQPQDTIVRMENCTFTAGNNAENHVVTINDSKLYSAETCEWNVDETHSALLFSDDELVVLHVSGDPPNQTLGTSDLLSKAPAERPGITRASPWFNSVQVRCF